MSVLLVPHDTERYPTLGPQIVDWMESYLVFGPGDLRGEPLVLDDEQRAFIYKFYELYPNGHQQAGRRRFLSCALSLAKGLRKTELLAAVTAAEVHHEAPVRFAGWDKNGRPIGRPVNDPVCLLIAATEDQSADLAYGTLRVMIEEGPLLGDLNVWNERIIRQRGDGKVMSLAGTPSARDGARTTFAGLDETHWWTLPRLKQAKQTIISNLGKRKLSDPWSLEVTTAPEPGAGSVAEDTYNYAKSVAEGKAQDARLFFFHRQASDTHNLETEKGARAAVIEASGPASEWRDIEGIMAQWANPTTDRTWWERVWCNRLVQSESKAFDVKRWKELVKDYKIADGALVVLGFDGSLFEDSTALIRGEPATKHIEVVKVWEKPIGVKEWRVPEQEVDDAVCAEFERYDVWRMYADPPYWQAWTAKWAGQFGGERVIEWWTNRRQPMTRALEAFSTAYKAGTITHDGNQALTNHIGNAHKHELNMRDDQGQPLYLIRKERSDSPFKIDAALAAVLVNTAMDDAIAAGATETKNTWSYGAV